MTTDRSQFPDSTHDRIQYEPMDSLDEELELEIDDERLAEAIAETAGAHEDNKLDRQVYFKELLSLQRELIKLQDWVVH